MELVEKNFKESSNSQLAPSKTCAFPLCQNQDYSKGGLLWRDSRDPANSDL